MPSTKKQFLDKMKTALKHTIIMAEANFASNEIDKITVKMTLSYLMQ